MKKTTHHLIAKFHSQSMVELTIGIDLGDVWSHLLYPQRRRSDR